MRILTLILNSFAVAFFALFLAYTFVAKTHLEELARDFVAEKTIAYAEPSVAIAEESLESPLVAKLLSEDQIRAAREEINAFQNDPSAYVSKLTGQQTQDLIPLGANRIAKKIGTLKKGIQNFYDGTLQALVSDLRIFAISNLVACLAAFLLAFFSPPKIRKSVLWFSILMFLGVALCSFMYVDGLSFFRILFRSHMGWWYAVLLTLTIATLCWDYGRHPVPADDPDGLFKKMPTDA